MPDPNAPPPLVEALTKINQSFVRNRQELAIALDRLGSHLRSLETKDPLSGKCLGDLTVAERKALAAEIETAARWVQRNPSPPKRHSAPGWG
jgi:hypothetical protein